MLGHREGGLGSCPAKWLLSYHLQWQLQVVMCSQTILFASLRLHFAEVLQVGASLSSSLAFQVKHVTKQGC